jgi:hypothetical protein
LAERLRRMNSKSCQRGKAASPYHQSHLARLKRK